MKLADEMDRERRWALTGNRAVHPSTCRNMVQKAYQILKILSYQDITIGEYQQKREEYLVYKALLK